MENRNNIRPTQEPTIFVLPKIEFLDTRISPDYYAKEKQDPNKTSVSEEFLQKITRLLNHYQQKWLPHLGNKLFNHSRHYAAWIAFFQAVAANLLTAIPELTLRLSLLILPLGRIITGLRTLINPAFKLPHNRRTNNRLDSNDDLWNNSSVGCKTICQYIRRSPNRVRRCNDKQRTFCS